MRNRAGKKILAAGMAVILTAGLFSDSSATTSQAAKKVKSVTITNPQTSSLYLKKGEKFQVKTKVAPASAKNKKLTFTSSNKKVAAVSAKGKVTAKKNGKAKITAAAKDKSGRKAAITVQVVKNFKKASGVSLDQKNVVLNINGNGTNSMALTASVTPKKATVKKVVYKTSDAAVAGVSAKGVVTAKKEGTVKITAHAADGRGAKAVCTVTVKKQSAQPMPLIVPSPTPSVAPPVSTPAVPTGTPGDGKQRAILQSTNNFRSYAVVTYSLPEEVKAEDISEISLGMDSDKPVSVRLYAGAKRKTAAELTGAETGVTDTVTGTQDVTVDGVQGTVTLHQLEIQETSSTRFAVPAGIGNSCSLSLDEQAKSRLAEGDGKERQIVIYPHAVCPNITIYDLVITTVSGNRYTIPLDETTVRAAEGGKVSFL